MPNLSNQIPTCFKSFSEYDIRENLFLLAKGVNRDSKIDINTVLTVIYGVTTFQIHLNNSLVLEKITNAILSKELARYKD